MRNPSPAEGRADLYASLRIAAAKPFYWVGNVFVVVADWLDPRPEGPNA